MANKNKSSASEAPKQPKYIKEMGNDAKDYSSLKVVLFYCSLIVFLPVITFFCLNSLILDRLFVLSEVKSNIFSAVGAVLALHVSLAVYIYRAYFVGSMPGSKKAD